MKGFVYKYVNFCFADVNNDTGSFKWTYGGVIKYQNWVHNPPPNHKGQLDCAFIQAS